ncbi:hypothetical protein BCV75_01195 [Xylella fastidiosa]|nr:hypothetical protein BCV75_01195 [Xylella fastidiosa]
MRIVIVVIICISIKEPYAEIEGESLFSMESMEMMTMLLQKVYLDRNTFIYYISHRSSVVT